MTPRTLELFAGPGGFDEAARLLDVDLGIVGFELNADAARTAHLAGHRRVIADVRTLDPTGMHGVTGLIVTPPCPTFSDSGKRSGMGDDYQHALDAITDFGEGCDCIYRDLPGLVADPRTALVVEAARFALLMPDVEWIVCEQVPGVEYLWEDLAAELVSGDAEGDGPGWVWVDVAKLNAIDYGSASRRERAFLMGRRYWNNTVGKPGVTYLPSAPIDAPNAADVLGWEAGERMRTRGNRKATGGNLFSLDGPSWCITGKARSWERDSDGARWDVADAGALNGFPRDYPWQGSRSAAFQQAGDVVSPLVGAAVLGATLGVEWEPQVRERVSQLRHGPHVALFDEVAS